MKLFDFSKTKELTAHPPLLGLILMTERQPIPITEIVSELRNKWKLDVNDKVPDKYSSILLIDGYEIVIADFPFPIPADGIELAAYYNYLWPDAIKETATYKAHMLVLILNSGADAVKENILYNKIVAAILNNTCSLGIYIGSRSLLLKKDFYIENAARMTEQNLPLFNFIYLGMRSGNGENSIYTLGLRDFGKEELEIINSIQPLKIITLIIYKLIHHILFHDITLKNGETVSIIEDHKIKIDLSDGVHVYGKSLKIEF